MSNKLVSVCINAYNAENHILETINSVINQSYKNLQIIVVDDCSTDNTYDIIKSIDDNRIELYKTPFNGHMSFACNEALKHVRGDYIAHLDADDLWAQDKIEKQIDFLENNPEYGACFSHAEIIDEKGNCADQSFDFMREMFALDNKSHSEMYRFFYDNSNKLCHSSALLKAEIVDKVKNYNVCTLFLQDFEYWMRLITYAPIHIIQEKLVYYRCGGNSNDMTNDKWLAYKNEAVRIIYNSINLCPDELFLASFADKLQFAGLHSHEETEIEKAFVLLDGPFPYKGNPILGILKFENLFRDEKYIKLAAEKFNFTTRDLYKIQENSCFTDMGEYKHLIGTIGNLNHKINSMQDLISELKDYNISLEKNNENQDAYIKSLESRLETTQTQLENMEVAYTRIKKMFIIRITLFFKKLFTKK